MHLFLVLYFVFKHWTTKSGINEADDFSYLIILVCSPDHHSSYFFLSSSIFIVAFFLLKKLFSFIDSDLLSIYNLDLHFPVLALFVLQQLILNLVRLLAIAIGTIHACF